MELTELKTNTRSPESRHPNPGTLTQEDMQLEASLVYSGSALTLHSRSPWSRVQHHVDRLGTSPRLSAQTQSSHSFCSSEPRSN